MCDQYALGAEMIDGYPLRTRAGSLTDIQSLLKSSGLS